MRRSLIVWFACLVLMAGANLATPLYPVCAERFRFSPLVLTVIFATYAILLVPGLVLFGRPSAPGSRRRVALVLRLPERGEEPPEPWRPQWPRVPQEIRRPFLRLGLTAGVVWATLA